MIGRRRYNDNDDYNSYESIELCLAMSCDAAINCITCATCFNKKNGREKNEMSSQYPLQQPKMFTINNDK